MVTKTVTTRKRPKPTRKRLRQIAEHWVRYNETRYAETGNPVFAWEAIAECSGLGLEFPVWVKRYLSETALKFHPLSRTRIPRKNQIDRAVARAVGLAGRGRFNPFNELARPGHELLIAHEVYREQTRNRTNQSLGQSPTHSWSAIFEDVARRHSETCDECKGVNRGTVKAYWYKHAKDVIPKHLVKEAGSKKLDDILR